MDPSMTQTQDEGNRTRNTAASRVQKGADFLDNLSEEYKTIRINIDSLLMSATLAGVQVSPHTRREIDQASRDARIYLIRGDRPSAERFISLLRKDAKELSSQLKHASPTSPVQASSA